MSNATHTVTHDGRGYVVSCELSGVQHVAPRAAYDGRPITKTLCLGHDRDVRLGCGCGAFASLPDGPTSGHDFDGCLTFH
jgi:hypothetical protein